MRHLHWATRGACALLTATLLAACGSGSTPSAAIPDPTPVPPAAITGIATPTSVAVVTATHAD